MPDADTFDPLVFIRRPTTDGRRVQIDLVLTQPHLLLFERLPPRLMGRAVENSYVVPIASGEFRVVGLVRSASQRLHEIGAIVAQRLFPCLNDVLLVHLPIVRGAKALAK